MRKTTHKITIRAAAASDVGRVRSNNEDAFSLWDLSRGKRLKPAATLGPRGALLTVCDGMGGAAAGEVASRIAADAIGRCLSDRAAVAPGNDPALALTNAVIEAGHDIRRDAEVNPSRAGMGTTVTACLVRSGYVLVAQVGDSRAYLMRGGVLTQITKDQTLAHHLLERGHLSAEEAKGACSNVILQALGATAEVSVELTFVEVRDGDRLLLCSDGLSGLIADDRMASVLAVTDDLSIACKRLLEMANRAGGDDNITALACELSGDALSRSTAPTVISPYVIGKTASPELATTDDFVLATPPWHSRGRWLAAAALLILTAVAVGTQLDFKLMPSASKSAPSEGVPDPPAGKPAARDAERKRSPHRAASVSATPARRQARPRRAPPRKQKQSDDEITWREGRVLFGDPFR